MGTLCWRSAKCPSEKCAELCEQLQDSGVEEHHVPGSGSFLEVSADEWGQSWGGVMGRGRPQMKRKAGNIYIQAKENPEPTLPPQTLVFLLHPFSEFLSLFHPFLPSVMKSLLVGAGVGTGCHYG